MSDLDPTGFTHREREIYEKGRRDRSAEIERFKAARARKAETKAILTGQDPLETGGPYEVRRAPTTGCQVPSFVNALAVKGKITANDIGLFCLLDQHARRDRVCWPSTMHLATLSQCSQSTIKRQLRRLEKAGAIQMTERWEVTEDGPKRRSGFIELASEALFEPSVKRRRQVTKKGL
jgi:hypothetical protein